MNDDDDVRPWSVEDLVAPRVRRFIDKGLITNVIVSIAYLDDDGDPAAVTIGDNQSPFWVQEGMLRSSLRDLTSVSQEATRRRAGGYLDRFED